MVKRLLIFISVAILMFSLSGTVFAGSVPEDLMHYDGAQIFFGEIIDYAPNAAKPHVSVCPVKKIKGDIKTGTKLVYENANVVGDIDIKLGNIYLFTYFDENNPTDIFEVTSYDTKTLKLKNVIGDMWERFEKYLNEGKYEKAEQDRIDKLNADLTVVGETVSLTSVLNFNEFECDKVEFSLFGKQDKYEIDKDKFLKLADEIILTDVENTLVLDTDDALIIRTYGKDVCELTIWDNCMVAGSRVSAYSAPTGDYIIKAEDYRKLNSLLPEEAQVKLPPLKNFYANLVYWYIYNSTTAYVIAALIGVVLIGTLGFWIGFKVRKKRSVDK